MNRQQRRKAQRRGVYVDHETMAAATGTNHQFPVPQGMADLPAKVQGRHRWILSTGYNVTDTEAATAHEGVRMVLMGPEKLISYGVGCYDCEQVYSQCVADPCPGDPNG